MQKIKVMERFKQVGNERNRFLNPISQWRRETERTTKRVPGSGIQVAKEKETEKWEKWNSAAARINSSCSDVVYIHYLRRRMVKGDWRMSLN